MFGNMDLGELLKQLQQQLEEEQNKKYTAKGGGGMVEVTVDGKLEVTDIKIDDSLLEDKESLEVLLISTINDAFKMALEDKRSSALSLFGNFSPEMFKK